MTLGYFYKKFIKEQGIIIDRLGRFAGDIRFAYAHAFIFLLWIVANLFLNNPWDPYPFIFLTLVVSLEAIFLASFILIIQNKDVRRGERRAMLDYTVDKKTEEQLKEIKKDLEKMQKLLSEFAEKKHHDR